MHRQSNKVNNLKVLVLVVGVTVVITYGVYNYASVAVVTSLPKNRIFNHPGQGWKVVLYVGTWFENEKR